MGWRTGTLELSGSVFVVGGEVFLRRIEFWNSLANQRQLNQRRSRGNVDTVYEKETCTQEEEERFRRKQNEESRGARALPPCA